MKSSSRIHETTLILTQHWKERTFMLMHKVLVKYHIFHRSQKMVGIIKKYFYLFLTGLSSKNRKMTVAFSTAANRTLQSSLYFTLLEKCINYTCDQVNFVLLSFYTFKLFCILPMKIFIKYWPQNIWSSGQCNWVQH